MNRYAVLIPILLPALLFLAAPGGSVVPEAKAGGQKAATFFVA